MRLLTISVGLVLAVVMLWSGPGLAQMRGKGQGGQGWGYGPGQGQGPGQGYANCPNYPGNQNCRAYMDSNRPADVGRRGFRGGNRAYQPGTPTPAPPATQ